MVTAMVTDTKYAMAVITTTLTDHMTPEERVAASLELRTKPGDKNTRWLYCRVADALIEYNEREREYNEEGC